MLNHLENLNYFNSIYGFSSSHSENANDYNLIASMLEIEE